MTIRVVTGGQRAGAAGAMRPIALASLLCASSALAAEKPAGEVRVHSITDIAHEFTFYFDGRFAKHYIVPGGGHDARNWATLHECDLSDANLLVLPGGPTPCPYPKEDIAAVRAFLAEGGGVAVLGDHAPFRGETEYRLNALARPFGAEFSPEPAREPLETSGAAGAQALRTYGGGTLCLRSPGEWHVLVRDAAGRPVAARRPAGRGHLLLASRALSGRRPDASDPINAEWWQPLLRDLARNKPVRPGRRPRARMPENRVLRGGLQIRTSDYLEPYAERIFEVYSRCRPVLERLLGVPPSPDMLTSLILLPTGGGGFSSGRDIGLGVWWGGFPEKQYGMVELLGHEATHSWVLPFPEPMWNEGIATYAGILAARELGMREEADATLRRWIDDARRHDPELKTCDLAGRGEVPHAVRMGKPMWIFEELRRERPDVLARYFQAKRRLADPARMESYSADDAVAVLSHAMGRDLFSWFRSLGTDVDRGRATVPRE